MRVITGWCAAAIVLAAADPTMAQVPEPARRVEEGYITTILPR